MSKKRGCTEELQRTPEGQHVLHVQTQERQAWIGGLWHMYLRGIEPSHGLSFSCVPAWGCNESVLGVSMATHRLMHCLASQFRHLRVCVCIEFKPTAARSDASTKPAFTDTIELYINLGSVKIPCRSRPPMEPKGGASLPPWLRPRWPPC